MITHIVYYATYKDEIVYIGTGDTNRYKHVKSGTSHVYKLNELYFKDKFNNENNLKVYIYRGYTCPEHALKDETMLINTFNPCFNVRKCDKGLNKKYMIKDIQEYMKHQENCFNEIESHLKEIKTNKDLYNETLQSIESGNDLFFKIQDDNIVKYDYWQDYIEYKLSIEETEYENYLPIQNLFNFNIDKLKKKKRVFRPAINDLIVKYNYLVENNLIDEVNEFLLRNQEFNEWIQAGVTTAMMHTLRYSRDKISKKAYELRTIGDNENKILKELDLDIGSIYTRDELIDKITNVYQKLNISTEKVKATEIKKWYEIKNSPKTIDGKNYTAYKILSKL